MGRTSKAYPELFGGYFLLPDALLLSFLLSFLDLGLLLHAQEGRRVLLLLLNGCPVHLQCTAHITLQHAPRFVNPRQQCVFRGGYREDVQPCLAAAVRDTQHAASNTGRSVSSVSVLRATVLLLC